MITRAHKEPVAKPRPLDPVPVATCLLVTQAKMAASGVARLFKLLDDILEH